MGRSAPSAKIPASEAPGRQSRRELARELALKRRTEAKDHASAWSKPSLASRRKQRRAAGKLARTSRKANR
jgi:hypothetical protein